MRSVPHHSRFNHTCMMHGQCLHPIRHTSRHTLRRPRPSDAARDALGKKTGLTEACTWPPGLPVASCWPVVKASVAASRGSTLGSKGFWGPRTAEKCRSSWSMARQDLAEHARRPESRVQTPFVPSLVDVKDRGAQSEPPILCCWAQQSNLPLPSNASSVAFLAVRVGVGHCEALYARTAAPGSQSQTSAKT